MQFSYNRHVLYVYFTIWHNRAIKQHCTLYFTIWHNHAILYVYFTIWHNHAILYVYFTIWHNRAIKQHCTLYFTIWLNHAIMYVYFTIWHNHAILYVYFTIWHNHAIKQHHTCVLQSDTVCTLVTVFFYVFVCYSLWLHVVCCYISSSIGFLVQFCGASIVLCTLYVSFVCRVFSLQTYFVLFFFLFYFLLLTVTSFCSAPPILYISCLLSVTHCD
jgi:hypothetical protein